MLHDNARTHITNMSKESIQTHCREVKLQPPNSPDLVTTDFHLFRSLSKAMREDSFNNFAELRVYLDEFFESKNSDFYKRGIENVAER